MKYVIVVLSVESAAALAAEFASKNVWFSCEEQENGSFLFVLKESF